MHTLTMVWATLWLVLAPTLAAACGIWPPKHGGQMNYEGGEIAFELVGKGRALSFHLEDHGAPVPTAQVTGTLRVQSGTVGWSGALKPDGDNRMVVQVPRALQKGDQLIADVSFSNGSIAQARFVYGVDVQLRAQFGTGRGFAASNAAPLVGAGAAAQR